MSTSSGTILRPCIAVCQPGEVSWRDQLPVSLQRLADLGVDADDAEDVRLEKGMFTLVVSLIAVMSFVWVATYVAIGLPRSAAIPSLTRSAWSRAWWCFRGPSASARSGQPILS